ncbi:MAG: YceI family protein [Bacteroidia bacterium]
MSTYKTILLLVMVIPFSGFHLKKQESGQFKFSPQESTITWKIIGDGYEGKIGLARGSIDIDYGRLNALDLKLDLDELSVVIPEKEKKQQKIIKDLRAEKNLNAELHPDISFKLTKASQKPDDEGWSIFEVTGRLIIKGIYEDITFPLMVKIDGEQVTATGQFSARAARWELKEDIYFALDLHGSR